MRIYDKMRQEEQEGIRPLYRPKDWEAERRIIDKRKKKHNWATKGGFTAPIMVPSTPDGELAKMLRSVAEAEATEDVRLVARQSNTSCNLPTPQPQKAALMTAVLPVGMARGVVETATETTLLMRWSACYASRKRAEREAPMWESLHAMCTPADWNIGLNTTTIRRTHSW